MGIEDLKARARVRASTIATGGPEAIEALRSEAMNFFSRVPEPPVYRRRDDPAIGKAHVLTVEGEKLLAQAYALEKSADQISVWTVALERHLAALTLVRDGKIEAAEGPWHEAVAAERAAMASKRLFSLSDDAVLPVFDKASSRSRFDPVAETSMTVKLVCPSCKKTSEYGCSTKHATHRFTCLVCRNAFSAYFGEVRSCEVVPLAKGRRYVFRLDELSGAQTQLHVDDWGRDALTVARRDLLAFLYSPATQLRGVLNLNSSRVLWLTTGVCFVATVAFGADAPELDVLRAFRDQRLRHSAAGRAFIEWYYREGPALAKWVSQHALRSRVTRVALRATVALVRRGLT